VTNFTKILDISITYAMTIISSNTVISRSITANDDHCICDQIILNFCKSLSIKRILSLFELLFIVMERLCGLQIYILHKYSYIRIFLMSTSLLYTLIIISATGLIFILHLRPYNRTL